MVTHEGSLRVVSHQDGFFCVVLIKLVSHQGGLLVFLFDRGTLSLFKLVSSIRVLSSIRVVSHQGGLSLMSMVSH